MWTHEASFNLGSNTPGTALSKSIKFSFGFLIYKMRRKDLLHKAIKRDRGWYEKHIVGMREAHSRNSI